MKSLLSDNAIAAVSNSKKYIFRIAVGVIIAAVVLSVFLILFGNFDNINNWETNVFGRVISTMFMLGIMLVLLHVTTRLLESKNPVSQIFAIIGGFFTIIYTTLGILSAWMTSGLFAEAGSGLARACAVTFSMTLFGLVCGAMMNIYEGKRRDVILPLKITATVLVGYELLYTTIVILTESAGNERLAILAGFAGMLWFFIWIVLLVLSRGEKKRAIAEGTYYKKTAPVKEEPVATIAVVEEKKEKTDDELRAEIREKLRREQIEREVREEMEKEKQK
ncbi:hypothetical protein IK110_00410 [Candidatus Saccharibacteria bacterium]|nr:hypothetical protein [Candidatus Saccharibacteria bacterium]